MEALASTDELQAANAQRPGLERSVYADSLAEFVKLVWPILHPRTPLIWNWPMQAICDHLEAVTDGRIRRLLINCPPGFSKSLLVNVFWPAWEWGPRGRPDLQYISWAYNHNLTIRDNRRCRDILEHEIYQRLWGHVFELAGDQNAKTRYDNDHHGFRIATSTGGTGERGNRNIVDDMHSVRGAESEAVREAALDWLANTLPTRVNDPTKDAFVYIGQRTHREDGYGHLIANGLIDCHLLIEMRYEGAEHAVRRDPCFIGSTIGWRDPRDVIGDLACPERFPESAVADIEKQMESFGGPYAAQGQLQQSPIFKSGGMFEDDWWRYCELDEVPYGIDRRAWDFAGSRRKTSPYTASALGRLVDGTLYVLDMTCDRFDAAELENKVVGQAQFDGIDVTQDWPQDPGQAGKAQVSSMAKRLHGYTHTASPESGEKSVRASPVAAQAKRGNVVLVRGPWNAAFIAEARLFPRSKFKDRIDALSRLHAGLVAEPVADEAIAGFTFARN
jgi:predicted phage terminase large subunit-like protein